MDRTWASAVGRAPSREGSADRADLVARAVHAWRLGGDDGLGSGTGPIRLRRACRLPCGRSGPVPLPQRGRGCACVTLLPTPGCDASSPNVTSLARFLDGRSAAGRSGRWCCPVKGGGADGIDHRGRLFSIAASADGRAIMRRKDAVWITGVGAATPVGNTYAEAADNLLAGKSGVRLLTAFNVADHASKIAASIKPVGRPPGWDEEAFLGSGFL